MSDPNYNDFSKKPCSTKIGKAWEKLGKENNDKGTSEGGMDSKRKQG